MGNIDQKTRPRYDQVYHLVKQQHHHQHRDPQQKLVQAFVALRKINY